MTRHTDHELELITRLRSGDPTAVDDLAAAYGPRIFQLALRYMKNREDAEEVAQDVLLKVYRKIDAFRGDSALSSWIYRITFNAAMSRLRNARFSRPAEVSEEDLRLQGGDERSRPGLEPPDWSMMADEALMRAQMRKRLEDAMEELPPIYRVPVVLRDIKGLTTEEASAVLNVKTQTLKSRLHRGRLILRQRLADFAGGLSLYPATS
ncbi:MAG: sigma-70 family RNA polymerase sigma factor [Acidobacteria bacterium]|nr:sigma-70 family RNA polymerase sigma factor [Acidobacteriota bacterium]